jgi:hypothetical protein
LTLQAALRPAKSSLLVSVTKPPCETPAPKGWRFAFARRISAKQSIGLRPPRASDAFGIHERHAWTM